MYAGGIKALAAKVAWPRGRPGAAEHPRRFLVFIASSLKPAWHYFCDSFRVLLIDW
jgi:hypothetical protein